MRHDVQDLVGTGVDAGRYHVRPVARVDAFWHEGRHWSGGASYLRPIRVEVTEADGSIRSIPIPDPHMRIRVAAIAVFVAALLIGRTRRWMNR